MLESVVIEKYFHLGYDYKTITDLLQVYHGSTMSVRTLERRLQSYNLVKKEINDNEDLVQNIVRIEMQVTGRCGIYFDSNIMYMHQGGLLLKFFMSWILMPVMHGRETNCRIYHSHGPSQCWHIELDSL